MPLDELKNSTQPTADWLPLDRSLLGEARPAPPAFPLHLLPGRSRTWVEASSRLFGSADYLAHRPLGGVACVGGAGIRIAVASHWHEPLLLWQALGGEPSSGRSAAFARVWALLAAVGSLEERGDHAVRSVRPMPDWDRLSAARSGCVLVRARTCWTGWRRRVARYVLISLPWLLFLCTKYIILIKYMIYSNLSHK